MRKTIALLSAAVTSMVAVAFLIPLAIIVRDVARDRALTAAQLTGASIEPVLAVTTDRAALQRAVASTRAGAAGQLAVYLTSPGSGRATGSGGATGSGDTAGSGGAASGGGTGSGQVAVRGILIGGPQHASRADLLRTVATAQPLTAAVPGGSVVLQPVALGAGRLAVTEVYVPAAEGDRGVAASWSVMAALAVVLIGVSVLVSERLATRITRPARALADAAAALGEGDLTVRSAPAGPPELVATGHAFNLMAERLSRVIGAERLMAADLPHRLRTPLTALRMNAASLGPGRAADETRLAVARMEQEVDLIIRAARRPAPGEPSGCDAAQVLRDRMDFWSALAEDQGRPFDLTGANRQARVPVPRSDLAAAADALIGNVFRHTAEGTGFAVTLHAGHDVVLIFFADAGPGIGDPGAALQRGASGAGSTGLGLDIARRVAEQTGGTLRIDQSALGGAQVQMWLRTGAPPARRPRRDARHISS